MCLPKIKPTNQQIEPKNGQCQAIPCYNYENLSGLSGLYKQTEKHWY
jgi:hypothetical protein